MTKATNSNQIHLPIRIGADTSVLSDANLNILGRLVLVAKMIDRIYLRQCNQTLESAESKFDAEEPKNFYPEGVTAAEIEAYVALNPETKEILLSPFTVVVKNGDKLTAVPYSEFYKAEMEVISQQLLAASELTTDSLFKQYLQLRSQAFLTNEFRASDIAWIHANNGPFEFTVGPYESYADDLFGVKRTFESILGLVLSGETALAVDFQDYVTKFDAFLGERYGYKPMTTLTPMVVMDQIYASGEAIYEYVPMAYNLPNDRDIHAEVGSKKVFVRNVMAAKFKHLTIKVAQKLLKAEDVSLFDFQTYLKFVIGHESAHGLSFHFDGQTFGTHASAIEEAKADVFGMWFLYYLEDEDFLDSGIAAKAVIQNLTDGMRQIRFGEAEAHAVGAIMQLNWFIAHKALVVNENGFNFDPKNFFTALTTLADELYRLAAGEDSQAVESFITEWGRTIPDSIKSLLPRLESLPVDIDPKFSF